MKTINKKGQVIEQLVPLTIGVVMFAVIVVVGIVVLANFENSQANCPAFVYDSTKTTTYDVATGNCLSGNYCTTVGGGAATLNTSLTLGVPTCYNATANYTSGDGVANVFSDTLSASQSTQIARYGATKLGNDSGGLLTWLPVILPAIIGIIIIGMFLRPKQEGGLA